MEQASPGQISAFPRVCFLLDVDGFYPPFSGGIEQHAYQLSKQLISRGQELFVLTRKRQPSSEPPGVEVETVDGILVKRVPPRVIPKDQGWKGLFPNLLWVIRVLYLLGVRDASRYDIVIVSGFKILSIPAILACKLAGKKCVIKVELPTEVTGEISPGSLKKMRISQDSMFLRLFRAFRNRFIKKADCFIAITSEIKNQFLTIGVDPQKIQSIPNGIDTDRFCPSAQEEKTRLRRKLSLPVEKSIFIFTGRLATSKGVMLIIQAWKEIARRHPGVHLVYVGSGKHTYDACEDELRDYIKTNQLEQCVSLVGEVGNVDEYLRASDVFVFPSEYEGYSLSLVEALASGLPSVASRVGAAEELIQDHKSGILIYPKDLKGFQTAVEWLLDHKSSWVEMGLNARQEILKKSSIEVVTDRYLQLFMELQDKRNPIYNPRMENNS